MLSRRSFTSGALSGALASQIAVPAFARGDPQMLAALSAVRAFGEADLEFNRLPGMTLGIVTPDGRRTVLNFGFANLETRAPITPDTLFQVGSITKLMVAAVFHQFAAEGKLRLSDRISDLLPEVPLPRGNLVRLQHVLDHLSGLPGDAPMFAEGGLSTGPATRQARTGIIRTPAMKSSASLPSMSMAGRLHSSLRGADLLLRLE